MKSKTVIFLFASLASLLLWSAFPVSAQYNNADAKAREKAGRTVPFKDMWSIRTNALEWLLTIPNIGVEFDLSNSIYNRNTIGVNLRYNWNTTHNYTTPMVFNVFEVRPEYRRYWRINDKLSFGNWFNETFSPRDKSSSDGSSRKKNNFWNKTWRAYYIGGYANAGTYSFKLGKEGHQGQMYGAGLIAGYVLPLYQYDKSAIDIEFGVALGFAATSYKAFGHNANGDYYYEIPSKSREFHVVPYPVVSELKVAFVYRMKSIDDKYKREDQQKIFDAQRREQDRTARMDSVKTARDAQKKLKEEQKTARQDSLAKVRELKKSGEWAPPAKVKDNEQAVSKTKDSKEPKAARDNKVNARDRKKARKAAEEAVAETEESETEEPLTAPAQTELDEDQDARPVVKDSEVKEKTIKKTRKPRPASGKSDAKKESRK